MTRSAQQRILDRLAHDVGKHIARAATNMHTAVPSANVIRMLIDDLYALDGRQRASHVFRELVAELDPAARPGLTRVVHALDEIDALETRVRKAEPDALLRAAALAREVRDVLRRQRQEDE